MEEKAMKKKYVCPVCGYVYYGEEPPAECPVCKVPGSKFKEVADEELTLAAEHDYGVYAKTVKNTIKERSKTKSLLVKIKPKD